MTTTTDPILPRNAQRCIHDVRLTRPSAADERRYPGTTADWLDMVEHMIRCQELTQAQAAAFRGAVAR